MRRRSTNFVRVGPALDSGFGVRCPCRRRRLGGAGGPISCLALWENAAPRTSAPPTVAPVHLRKSRLPGSASACFFPAFMMRTPGRICRPQGLVHRRFRGRRSARLPTWLDGEYNNVNRASGGQTKGAARSLPSAPVPRRTPRAPATRRTHGTRVPPEARTTLRPLESNGY